MIPHPLDLKASLCNKPEKESNVFQDCEVFYQNGRLECFATHVGNPSYTLSCGNLGAHLQSMALYATSLGSRENVCCSLLSILNSLLESPVCMQKFNVHTDFELGIFFITLKRKASKALHASTQLLCWSACARSCGELPYFCTLGHSENHKQAD